MTLDQALPAGNSKEQGSDTHKRVWKKWWNDFFHPVSYHIFGHYHGEKEMEAQLQVGSKLYPTYPIRNCQEAFYSLRKCMGIEASNFHSLDITAREFRRHKYVLAFDTEKMLGTAFQELI